MRRSLVLAALILVAPGLAAGPARAGEATAPTAADESVSLSTVALPLVFDGQVVNYVFVSVKLLLTRGADPAPLRDKEPYFRDALVRAGHRTPFVRAGDYNHLDEARLKAALMREASAIAGPGKIVGVAVLSETPMHRVAAPRPATGAAIEP